MSYCLPSEEEKERKWQHQVVVDGFFLRKLHSINLIELQIVLIDRLELTVIE